MKRRKAYEFKLIVEYCKTSASESQCSTLALQHGHTLYGIVVCDIRSCAVLD